MSRLALTFECQGCQLAGTLDTAPGKTGLLIVSGGNEIRAGTFSGQSQLAAKIASAGFPVFRFDRRGIGDSDGENRGFTKSRKDIEAAVDAFRAIAPQIDRVFAFGNCDAASSLMMFGGSGCEGLILSNPWTIEGDDNAQPASVVRSRYADKLKNPKEIARLLTGGVNLRKLFGGLRQAASSAPKQSGLVEDMRSGIAKFDGDVMRYLIARDDRTAQMFLQNWFLDDRATYYCHGASHAYVEPHAREWLEQQVLAALRS